MTMQTEAGAITAAERFASDLRALANFYEQHPELPAPEPGVTKIWVFLNSKSDLQTFARASKGTKYADTSMFGVKREFGSVTLYALAPRELVCERTQVGTRILPAVEAREVPVYEWTCEPILGDDA